MKYATVCSSQAGAHGRDGVFIIIVCRGAADGARPRRPCAPRVEYSLTPLGRSLEPVIEALRVWGEGFKARMGA
ncbi:winged helix-turn-helix transcriptional regulator [Collinsella intestinalis]|uniref:winged helix-turn-helix transcriptional regulator n=1 Tax=Collinsella intestinalis TaxID=147207 RepID=UPI00195B8E3F|nr:winged helix-turn-helix transcriptional regulator [Collinsella intestinalis]